MKKYLSIIILCLLNSFVFGQEVESIGGDKINLDTFSVPPSIIVLVNRFNCIGCLENLLKHLGKAKFKNKYVIVTNEGDTSASGIYYRRVFSSRFKREYKKEVYYSNKLCEGIDYTPALILINNELGTQHKIYYEQIFDGMKLKDDIIKLISKYN